MKKLINNKYISVTIVVFLIIAAMVSSSIPVDAAYAVKTPAKASLTKVSNAAKGVKLTWKRASGASGYVIYRKYGSGTYKKIATVKDAEILKYVDKKVKNTCKYTYRIRAYRSANGSKAYGAYSKRKGICYVSRPALRSVGFNADMTPAVSYKANKKATGYQIKLTAVNGVSQVMSLKKFRKQMLAADTVYYVQMRAVFRKGKKKYHSAWSSAQPAGAPVQNNTAEIPFGGDRTVYYASDVSDFTKTSVEGAGYTKVTGSDVIPAAFVVKGDALAGLSDADAILSLRTCLAGNLFVIDAPTFAQMDAFWTRTLQILDSDPANEEYEYLKAETELSKYTLNELLDAYGEEEGYTASNDEHVFDSISMYRGQVYFVHDIDQVITEDSGLNYSSSGVEVGEENKKYYDKNGAEVTGPGDDTDSNNDPESPDALTVDSEDASDAGLESEAMTDRSDDDWTDIISQTSGRYSDWMISASTSSMDDLQKAQSACFSFTVAYSNVNMRHIKDESFKRNLSSKKEVVQVFVDAWTACDIAKQQEYWLIRSSYVCNNDQLACIEEGKDEAERGGYLGPYFTNLYTHYSMAGADLRPNDCSPRTSVGSESFTSGSSFTLGGNIGMTMAGPTGGISYGYSTSQSSSRSIPDISVVFNQKANDNSAYWEFNAPAFNPEYDLGGILSDVKPIQKQLTAFDTYALYTRSSSYDSGSPNGWLTIDTKVVIEATEFWTDRGFLWDEAYLCPVKQYSRVWHHIPFNRPNNLCGEYVMSCTMPAGTSVSDSNTLNSVLAKSFQGWGANVNYYAYGDVNNKFATLDPVARNTFKGVEQKIKTNQNVLKDQGFSGTYEFYIQNVSTGQKVDSFTLTF